MTGPLRRVHAGAICSACAAGVSILCMSSMAVALAGTAGAAAAGMAGMESMSTATVSFWPHLLGAVGLGGLASLPNEALQTLLAISLALSVVTTYLVGRARRRLGPFLLVGASAFAMYASIYLVMSEPLYTLTLITLVAGALWSVFDGRRTVTA